MLWCGPKRMLDDPGRLEPVLTGKGGNGRRAATMLRVIREAKPAMWNNVLGRNACTPSSRP
ncbi:hypothetical protein GCM10009675_04200 [Prauserella alba]|uniref:Transposase n=1 Tax=Prauserella alba TaxID=176898 RepID=A0ABP4FNB8_9PSEU